jgi:hypothetical protein
MVCNSTRFSREQVRLKLIHNPVALSGETLAEYWRELFDNPALEEHSHFPSGRPFVPGVQDDVSVAHCDSQGHDRALLLSRVPYPYRIGVDIESNARIIRGTLGERLHLLNPFASALTTWTLLEAACKCADHPFTLTACHLQPLGDTSRSEAEREWTCYLSTHQTKLRIKAWSLLIDDMQIAIAIGNF